MKTYKFWLLKAYFDEGWNVLNYAKYAILALGMRLDLQNMFILWGTYAVFAFIVGIVIYEKGYIEEKNEVSNNYNPFQKEVRRAIRKRNI